MSLKKKDNILQEMDDAMADLDDGYSRSLTSSPAKSIKKKVLVSPKKAVTKRSNSQTDSPTKNTKATAARILNSKTAAAAAATATEETDETKPFMNGNNNSNDSTTTEHKKIWIPPLSAGNSSVDSSCSQDSPPGSKKSSVRDVANSASSKADSFISEQPYQTNNTTSGNDDDKTSGPVKIPRVSFFRQLRYTLFSKNWPLLQRKPIHVLLMIFSSVGSVLLAWAAVRKEIDDVDDMPEYTDCGTIPHDYFLTHHEDADKAVFGFNDKWRSGTPVAIMSLGPLLTAICSYLIIHEELSMHMLGVLRQLGLRDSVYWTSWYICFALIGFINSFLAAITAKTLPVHVFEHTYFGGILGSLFFVQLALIGCSLFLAALSGTARRGPVWLILCMIIAVWIPLFVMAAGAILVSPESVTTTTGAVEHSGLYWLNRETLYVHKGKNRTVGCTLPILSQKEGNFYKTEAERELVQPDQFFLGCYATTNWASAKWSPNGAREKAGLAALWFFPYFHFNVIWGNFCGLTSNPGNSFNLEHSSMTAGELAREGLPVPPSDANSWGTTLFPQGSMIQQGDVFKRECEEFSTNDPDVCVKYKSNCPAYDLANDAYDFCLDENTEFDCVIAVEPSPVEGVSVHAAMGMLIVLSLFYSCCAVYWGIVFVGGTGTHRADFIFWPSYWFGTHSTKGNISSDGRGDQEAPSSDRGEIAVKVYDVSKRYGGVEAVKSVSMEMARGEITALLGHNGAGKTTLSKIVTCEIKATGGDVTVFGHSVRDDPFAVQRLVGVCKQDDYLYPSLNAREHLELFGGIQGIEPDELDEIVQKWLESVDLDTVQHLYTSQFSGGMKRRLSLALSTIGQRPLIVLDEPTTGMDPVSRRLVWKHIDEIKNGRVILLTTHAMEEADLLSDMVAIVRKGDLAAWGTPLELKTEHGSMLQFSLLVDKSKTTSARSSIIEHFNNTIEFVEVNAGEAGNITVNIKKIKQGPKDEGIPVGTLTNFVSWLESPESDVMEYGFSNSSLEEVFLKVTAGDVEASNDQQSQGDATIQATTPNLSVPGSDLVTYVPHLTIWRQVRALVWQVSVRSWIGWRSIGSWGAYGLFVAVNTTVMVKLANANDKIAALALPVGLISFILLSVCSTVYGDRSEGLFYLMRTQGLLKTSYLVGTATYAFLVSFIYSFLMLTGTFLTPFMRQPGVCTPDYENDEYCDISFGQWPVVSTEEILEILVTPTGDPIYAYLTPGGYGYVFAACLVFALTVPGTVLASSYLPGHKFALVVIAFLALLASLTPLIIYFTGTAINSLDEYSSCQNAVAPLDKCSLTDPNASLNEDFLNCIGFAISKQQSLCIPSYVGLLPQFGLFQMLSMVMMWNIRFYSENSDFVENVFLANIKGAQCSSDGCAFPYAAENFGRIAGWEIFGAFILICIGIAVSHVFAFPSARILHWKNRVKQLVSSVRCQPRKHKAGHEENSKREELEEVGEERGRVEEIVRPFISESSDDEIGPVINDHSLIPRDEISPILMHRLRKVYPSIGRLPPKVALKSLDLHVPRGQVLGFLGKNGAGKTTALKILAGAHGASSGVSLVSGYDASCERIRVFESLGNCPQFDVVWPKLSVREHLVFFAKLKGIPRSEVEPASRNIASAVGLGTDAVYNRRAADLSGGMRRRLSIAISLVGAPKVFVLDEPTTGLDPSTRNNIWALVNSFATEDRAIVITTHMMLEADTLCNRIAIISKGELAVVASQQTLKDKYGSGYLLQLNLVKSTPENQETAMEFVRKYINRNATLNTKQAKTLHISLPRGLNLKSTFAALYNPRVRPECVNQFLLSQSSLEDVFLSLGE